MSDKDNYIKIEPPIIFSEVLNDLIYILEKHIHMTAMWKFYYKEWNVYKKALNDPKEKQNINRMILELKHDIGQYDQYLSKSDKPDQETDIKNLKKDAEKRLVDFQTYDCGSFMVTPKGLHLNKDINQAIKDRDELIDKMLSCEDFLKIGKNKTKIIKDIIDLYDCEEERKSRSLLVEINHLYRSKLTC